MLYQQQITQAFWQGMVKLLVLHQAGVAPLYGGRLSKYLSSLGYNISPGSLYPLLHAMEKAELLHSRIRIFKGRVRKYYELTPQGHDCLEAVRREVGGVIQEVIFGGPPHGDLLAGPAVPGLLP
jgi:PadR family transcriptional regulator PadR